HRFAAGTPAFTAAHAWTATARAGARRLSAVGLSAQANGLAKAQVQGNPGRAGAKIEGNDPLAQSWIEVKSSPTRDHNILRVRGACGEGRPVIKLGITVQVFSDRSEERR